MNVRARLLLDEATYLAWEARQDRKHELVRGEPRMMAGAQAGHNRVARNILRILGNQLLGKPCEPFGSDMKVRIPNANYRYPDALVDCGRPADDALFAADPRVVFEVLSPSTEFFDQADKLEDYQSITGLAAIVLFKPDEAWARVWTRVDGGWTHADVKGPEGVIALPALDAQIALADAYDGVVLRDPQT